MAKRRDVPEDWDWRKLAPRREKLGLSHVDVAAACGIRDLSTIRAWESGEQRPRMPQFLKLLRVLQWDFWDSMPDQ